MRFLLDECLPVRLAELLNLSGPDFRPVPIEGEVRVQISHIQPDGLLRRVHAGAVSVESPAFEPRIGERTTMATEKQRVSLRGPVAVLLDPDTSRPR